MFVCVCVKGEAGGGGGRKERCSTKNKTPHVNVGKKHTNMSHVGKVVLGWVREEEGYEETKKIKTHKTNGETYLGVGRGG